VIRAARILGVPPWELQDQPLWWQLAALEAEHAEAAAQEEWSRQVTRQR